MASSPESSFELEPVINIETFKVALNELITFSHFVINWISSKNR